MSLLSFEEFVDARHYLWLEKSYGIPAPERSNILRGYHYTNLWRELDRGTRYLFNEIQQPRWEEPRELIRHTFIYRVFNHIHTYEALLKHGLDRPTHEIFGFLSGRDQPNFNSAAYIRCNGLSQTCDQITELDDLFLEDLADALSSGDSKSARGMIGQLFSMGAFTGDQLMLDLCWEGGPFPCEFTPKFGPGAVRGFQYCEEFGEITPESLLEIADEMIPEGSRPLVGGKPLQYGVRELEHTLCELAKHVKLERADGRYVKMRKHNPQPSSHDPLPFNWQEPQIIKLLA